MNFWNGVNPIPCPEWLPSDLKAAHAELETERQAIVAERAKIDADRARLESADAAAAIADAGDFRQRVAAVLQRELVYRDQVEAFLTTVIPASGVAVSAAEEGLQATEAQVIAFLEKGNKALGGYVRPVEGEVVVGSWTREMVIRHPAVVAARILANDSHAQWAADHRGVNENGRQLTLTKLDRLKAEALAV